MKISGFSFVRNGIKLYYPVAEAIKSALPICSEFIIAVGKGDEDDNTRSLIEAIADPKIKIIDTDWDQYKPEYHGHLNAIQTDIALKGCSGDWCLYLQADEVIHEKYLPVIEKRCAQLLADPEVEGLLFGYKHFWGDYWHYQAGHGWYQREIRIIRNSIGISSHLSAQSFRKNGEKLKVAQVEAEIFHYGWVRPPQLMQNKKKALDTIHWGKEKITAKYSNAPLKFDYGPLDRLAVFKGSHPAVMAERIKMIDWKDQLQYSGKPDPHRPPLKHEKWKYRLLSSFENAFWGGKHIGEYQNFVLLKR